MGLLYESENLDTAVPFYVNIKTLREDAHLAEKKLAVNSTARARKSRKRLFILKNREKKYVNHQIEELSIKCAGRDQSVSQLSGGNKQKVVFGKWIGCGSEILILDCPTRGVDIGVKQAMYQLMVRLKNEGKSILMISEELPELIGMSDRILIMKNGEVSAEFERSETLSDAQIIEYMI